jgi:small-conductance mechanosensitive channel
VNLEDLERWARGSGLEIVLLGVGAVLLVRAVQWISGRLIERAQRSNLDSGDLIASEKDKHKSALAQAVSWTATAVIYFVAALLIMERFNVPITSLVAPATVAGAAIGFGSQRLVQDFLTGFFIFAERQFGYGDVIQISQPGQTVGISGTVEELTLRTTTLRTLNGELVIIPNGEIRQVTNLSRDWARVVIDIPLALDADVGTASSILRDIGEELTEDEEWSALILDPPSVMGVEKLAVGFIQLRFVARTLPARQWDVSRELRARIIARFREAGIATAQPYVAAAGEPTGL